MAASIAVPPARKISRPASVAYGFAAATMPVFGAGVVETFELSVLSAGAGFGPVAAEQAENNKPENNREDASKRCFMRLT